jgi:rubrerythrin
MKLTDNEMKFLLKSQQGELDAVLMYKALAVKVKNEKDIEAFHKLAADEGRHAMVLKGITNQVLKPKKTMARIMPLLYTVLGRKRLYRLIAQGEYAAIDKYQPYVERFPEMESVKNDEKRHGDVVMGLLANE